MVSSRLKPWQLGLLLVSACTLVLGMFTFFRFRKTITPAEMLKRLPSRDSVLLYIDFKGLRETGLLEALSGSTVAQDADYRAFVSLSGFDYQRDLESVFASFRDGHVFVLASGRFDWPSLRSYVTKQKGQCLNGFCRFPASQPDRFLSFHPLQTDYLAFASSPDPYAATHMDRARDAETPEFPTPPVWVSVPGSKFRTAVNLPAGAKLFATALADTEVANFGLDRAGPSYFLTLEVRTKSLAQASIVVLELNKITTTMATYFERMGQKPNPADLSGVLTAGKFEQQGNEARGRWQISQQFIEALIGGRL